MDIASVSSNTRAAVNAAEGSAATAALKIAVTAEQAVVDVVAEAVETARAAAPAGQGQKVDKYA
jgi:F0F1-type ATP synthase membrane subunit b/b'